MKNLIIVAGLIFTLAGNGQESALSMPPTPIRGVGRSTSAYNDLLPTGPSLTDEAYIAAYQKLSSQYLNNQTSMGDHLAAVQKLKDQYLKGRSSTALPVVP